MMGAIVSTSSASSLSLIMVLELVIPPTKRPGSVVVTRPASHGEVPGSNPGLVVLFSLTNGRAGFLGEHSCKDGTPTLRISGFILSSLAAGKVDHGSPSVRADLPMPKELTFDLDAATKQAISAAEAQFDELVGQHDMEVLHYEAYGKNQI